MEGRQEKNLGNQENQEVQQQPEEREGEQGLIQKKETIQPVDRPLDSEIKGKNQFKCAGSLFTVDDRYEFVKRIGYGAYGVVCSVNDKVTDQKVAIKKIPKAFQDLVDAKRVLREIKILKFFDHENVVSLVDIQRPPTETGYEDVYIVTELMEADLHRLIYSKQRLTDDHYQYFMYQLLRGVLFLHSANIMHRDLKPSNILVNMNCDLKICDFGLARGFGSSEEDKDLKKTAYVVTRWYRAPEVMLNSQYYTEALDMWSIGCIFAELMLKECLFPGQHNMKQLDKIVEVMGPPKDEDLAFITNETTLQYLKKLTTKEPLNWSKKLPDANPVALDLLFKMLQFSPDKRISVTEAMNHPYFQSFAHLGQPPVSETIFDWSWDRFEFNKELLQKLIYMESLYFHPEEEQSQDISTLQGPPTKTSEEEALKQSLLEEQNKVEEEEQNQMEQEEQSRVEQEQQKLPAFQEVKQELEGKEEPEDQSMRSHSSLVQKQKRSRQSNLNKRNHSMMEEQFSMFEEDLQRDELESNNSQKKRVRKN